MSVGEEGGVIVFEGKEVSELNDTTLLEEGRRRRYDSDVVERAGEGGVGGVSRETESWWVAG